MKKLPVLFAFAVLAALVSCTDPDSDDYNRQNPSPDGVITKIVMTPVSPDSWITPLTHNFTYNFDKQLVRAEEIGPDGYNSLFDFVWQSDRISKRQGMSNSVWATLNENGQATEYWSDYDKTVKLFDFTYDEYGRLAYSTGYANSVEWGRYLCSWDANGDISGFTLVENGKVMSKSTATYTSYPNDGNLNLNWFIDGVYLGSIDYDLASIGFFGVRSNYRIATYDEEWDGGSRHITFDYEFDSAGRVTKITEDVAGGGEEDVAFEIYY